MRIEYRFAEFRADAITGERTLSGVAMPYGSLAQLRGFRERFEPRAFGDLSSADVTLNVQHDRGRVIARTGAGGLSLLDGSAALEIRAKLPDTREAADVLTLIRAGVLRGLSVEFAIPDGGDRFRADAEGPIRTVSRAGLLAVAVVDKPAYGGAGVNARYADPEVMRRAEAVGQRARMAADAFRPWEL